MKDKPIVTKGIVEYETVIRAFSSSAHIPCKKEFIGRIAHVIIYPDDETETKN